MSKSMRDEKVGVRNALMDLLDAGCKLLNLGKRDMLANAIKMLHNEAHGFIVDTKTTDVYEFFGDEYTGKDGIIIIREQDDMKLDGSTIIELAVVLKLKSGDYKGEWRAYELNQDYFLTDAEQEEISNAEAQWERDAESAYERHLDYRASFDDPRGY